MSQSAEIRQMRAERVEEAAGMLRSGVRPNLVRKKMRDKYDVTARAVEEWVKDAMRMEAPYFARNLNMLRYADENELRYAANMALRTAKEAADAKEFIGTAANLRSFAAIKGVHHKMWHLDKISPLMGLEASETRAQLVEAIRDSAHLLTDEQRQELQDALNESADDETETTTLPPARSARR